jgi:5-methylcytosine-specific restriction endonuclease McrA
MRQKKEPKPYAWDAKIMAALRKVWRFSPERREALAAATHPENRQEVVCSSCGVWCHAKLAKVDHIEPVMAVEGWDSWNGVIHRLQYGALQVLCEECHRLKTKAENAERARYRKMQKACRKGKQ